MMDPVADRNRSATEIIGSNRQFGRSIARALEEQLCPGVEDADFRAYLVRMQNGAAGLLERRWRELADADDACDNARQDRYGLIHDRDDVANRLYREVVDLRLVCRGRFGAARARNFLGLRDRTSRDPVMLLKQADRAVARLRDRHRRPPASRIAVSDRERRLWAEPVAERADALRDLLARVGRAKRRLEAAQLARRRALEVFDRTFVRVATLLEAAYRLAGFDQQADRLRPSKQHLGWLHREDKKRSRRTTGKRKQAARLLSFRTLRKTWRQHTARRQSR